MKLVRPAVKLVSAICEACPAKTTCEASLWNEFGGGAEEGEISMVHTCPTCVDDTVYHNIFGKDSTPVSKECPRHLRNPRFCSALQCHACESRYYAIQKAHPNYQDSLKAVRGMFSGLIAGVEEGREAREASLKEYCEATRPHLPVLSDVLINEILALVAPVIAQSPRSAEHWEKLDTSQQFMRLFNWAETVHISRTILGSDPETVAQDLILSFVRPRGIWGWMDLSREHRNRVRARWAEALS